jgi:hypothetical protein
MMRRNPTLIKLFGARRNRRSISILVRTRDVGALDRLTTNRFPNAGFGSALLREELPDPGAVDEVASAREEGCKEEVEEYAISPC